VGAHGCRGTDSLHPLRCGNLRVRVRALARTEGTQLEAAAPCHLEATVRILQRRATNLVDTWEGGTYRRALATSEGLVLTEVGNRGTVDAPDLRAFMRRGDTTAAVGPSVATILRRLIGLDVDPEPLQSAAQRERHLRPVAVGLRGMRPPRFASLFDSFLNVVPFQQLSLDAGISILNRLVERFGASLAHDGRRYHTFPSAHSIAVARLDVLRSCGLSASKAQTLRGLARMIEKGELRDELIATLSTPEALRALVNLPGIGPWSAALVLLRGFGRLDVFPPGDVGAARELSALLHLRSADELGRVVQRFGDQRGYLYFYALGASLLAAGRITPASAAPAEVKSER
jgi:DNA-3-methyladenine glycosylase II